ncbi:MAG TPA: VOC family protein [Actinomycetota bacterium]|nr:VOC family protein [Actinomycetota bacterium]
MPTQLSPYISFRGQAREAMQFYRDVFGGELSMNTFAEFGQADAPFADQIMHAMLVTTGGLTLMGSDIPPGMAFSEGQRVTLAISGEDEAELRGYWNGLIDGGTVMTPLDVQIWGDLYGQCTDRFGVVWLVNISATGD